MCKHGTGWDEPLPSELRPKWDSWKEDLTNLEKVTIPRCYLPSDFGKVIGKALHHFSDASTPGYGQCSYLRQVDEEGRVHCALVLAKSRVAPIKLMTIPRLELTAAVVSVTVSNILKEELGLTNIDEYFWTDFKVVLAYINNKACRFHTFVSNRIQKIHHSTVSQQWRYVQTNNNPADHASRGLSVNDLFKSSWFTGPPFLWEKDILLAAEIKNEIQIGDPEVKWVQTLDTQTKEHVSLSQRLSKFSSRSKVIQAIVHLVLEEINHLTTALCRSERMHESST